MAETSSLKKVLIPTTGPVLGLKKPWKHLQAWKIFVGGVYVGRLRLDLSFNNPTIKAGKGAKNTTKIVDFSEGRLCFFYHSCSFSGRVFAQPRSSQVCSQEPMLKPISCTCNSLSLKWMYKFWDHKSFVSWLSFLAYFWYQPLPNDFVVVQPLLRFLICLKPRYLSTTLRTSHEKKTVPCLSILLLVS